MSKPHRHFFPSPRPPSRGPADLCPFLAMIALRCHSGNHSRVAAKREEEAGPGLGGRGDGKDWRAARHQSQPLGSSAHRARRDGQSRTQVLYDGSQQARNVRSKPIAQSQTEHAQPRRSTRGDLCSNFVATAIGAPIRYSATNLPRRRPRPLHVGAQSPDPIRHKHDHIVNLNGICTPSPRHSRLWRSRRPEGNSGNGGKR